MRIINTIIASAGSETELQRVLAARHRSETHPAEHAESPKSLLSPAPAARLSPPPKSAAGALLLVDDEPSILDLLTRAAEIAGYPSFRASNGAEALEIFERHREEIGLILTDVHMPGMDGFAFLRAVREMVPDVSVIVSSGSMGEAEQQFTSGLSVSAFLRKPYTSAELVSCIRAVAEGWDAKRVQSAVA